MIISAASLPNFTVNRTAGSHSFAPQLKRLAHPKESKE